MSFRVELEGEACPDPGLGGDGVPEKAPQTPDLEEDLHSSLLFVTPYSVRMMT